MNLRHWMAACIQAKSNAPCKERKRESSNMIEHMKQKSPQLALRSQNRRREQRSSPDLSVSVYALSPHHHVCLSKALAGVTLRLGSNRSSKRVQSDNSSSSFSFGTFMHSGSEAGFPQSKSKRSKRLRGDTSTCGSQKSRQVDFEPTFTPGACLPSDTSTNITMSDMRNINHELSLVDRTRQKLQLNLIRFRNNELDYAGARREVIQPTRQLYADSPHRKPYSNLEFGFKNFNQALDHWGSLIKRLTTSSDVTKSSHDDLLEDLAAQGTFKGHVAKLYNSGPRSQVDFPLDT
jgi:hypothetical protein